MRRSSREQLLLLILLFGATGSGAQSQGARKVRAAPLVRKPNVLLITVDTVRADHLGCYGGKLAATPAIDRLCADGVVFERAISQVPLTWPSHAAIMTGTYPYQNGVQDFTSPPLDPKFHTIAQALKEAGYDTGAVISSFVLDRSFGLARGFDFYDDYFPPSSFKSKDMALVERPAGESVDHAIRWLGGRKQRASRPFFFWLHLYDPHSPYASPEPFASDYKDHPYDGAISYADSQLGRLFAWLRERSLYNSTLIVLLSDHGESLGEHGEKEHGFFIYNATTHVPLIIKLPHGLEAVNSGLHRVKVPVETIDVAPTILTVLQAHHSLTSQLQGRPFFSANDADRSSYSETFYPFSSFGWSPLHSLESSRYHFIQAPKPELYDVVADPGEKENIVEKQPAVAAEMGRALSERASASVREAGLANSQLTPEAVAKLRSLGYMAYRSPVSPEQLKAGLPDPKDRLDEFNAILRATDLLHTDQYQDGVKLLEETQRKDPGLYLIPYMLGEAALKHQHWNVAQEQLEKALQLNPTFDQAMTALARAYFQTGKIDESRKWLQKALDENPNNFGAWYELGLVESRSKPEDAIKSFERALKIQPNFALAHLELGTLRYGRHECAKAIPSLEQAEKLGAADAVALNNLGICYSQAGQLSLAMQSYKRALVLDPKLAQAHLNLGFAYQKLGQFPAAQAEYKSACELDSKFCEGLKQ